MVKRLSFVLSMICILAFAFPCHAILREDTRVAQGKVLSKSIDRNEIIIDDVYSGEPKTFVITEDHCRVLQKNDEVFITFQQGTNQAKYLKIVRPSG